MPVPSSQPPPSDEPGDGGARGKRSDRKASGNTPRRKPTRGGHGSPRRSGTPFGDGGRKETNLPPAAMRQIEQLAPDSAGTIPALRVKGTVASPLYYRKRIGRVDHARPGDLVAVYDQQQLVGYGLYNSRSEISLRMLWEGPQLPDDAMWDAKLSQAVEFRHGLLNVNEHTNAYRVIYSESDGLSGLVVDRFGDVLSAEVFSLGMYQRSQAILQRLESILETSHTVIQTSPHFLSQEGCDPPPIISPDAPEQVVIREFGTRFRVGLKGGHKTGFFCDQRENRHRLASMCEGKTVLDLCCYTGGFSVQAKVLGKAAEVTGVDLDEAPLALAKQNANLNQTRIKFVHADAFAYMRDMIQNGRKYDVVILDPPKLIRTRAEIEEGTRKHFALNKLAMQLVKPGGLMLSCTCAGLLSEADFMQLLVAAARQSGAETGETMPDGSPKMASRTMKVFAKTGAAPDHPVLSSCLETEYLQAVWMILY